MTESTKNRILNSKDLTYNEKMILIHANDYKKVYFENFKVMPESWFSFTSWLFDCFHAHNFTEAEVKLAESYFEY